MRQLGWCLLAACAVAGACQGSKDDSGDAVVAGSTSSLAGSSGNGGMPPILNVGGSLNTAATAAQETGGRAPLDLSGVETPVVRCHPALGAGGQAGSDDDASGGQTAMKVLPQGGAPWDDMCAPPPSLCLDDRLTLVYFDQGECVAGLCSWQKMSMNCRSLCQDTGCQDSITTK